MSFVAFERRTKFKNQLCRPGKIENGLLSNDLLNDMSSRVTLAKALFEFLDRSRVPYVVVGDVREYGNAIDSDVDIVISKVHCQNYSIKLKEFCSQTQGKLVQVIQHEQTAWYFVLVWRNKCARLQFLHVDICSDFYRQGTLFLKDSELLEGASQNNLGFSVPAPDRAFIYYLLKKIDKGSLSDQQFTYLRSEWLKDPQGAVLQVRRFWSDEESQFIADSISSNNAERIRANIPQLTRSLRTCLEFSFQARWNKLVRNIKRLIRPTGVLAVFLGADGSGKTTVINEVETTLAAMFRQTCRYHLRPNLGKTATNRGPVIDPHGQQPRGWLLSLLKIGYWWMDYVLGYLTDVYLRIVKSTFVIFDRYYYDLLVDPERYRYGAPLWIARLVGWFIPRPDLVILLDASAEVLQSRKQEVPLEETRRQREAYLKLVYSLPNGKAVNASRPLNEIIRQVEDILLDYMAKRTARRLGLE
jgi:thymidylate kinase